MFTGKILDDQIISQPGYLKRIRRWWQGVHPELGTITFGWTGWETVQEKDVLPIHTFTVTE
jgi:hypothetical protein